LAKNSGLIDAINENVYLLKRHLPYHESDHVLGVAYNLLSGGTCLQDIEQRRQDEVYRVLPASLRSQPVAVAYAAAVTAARVSR
jgi:hypothetical protein